MKALQKTERGPGHVHLREVAEPSCGPGQVKIRVAFAGICGTDILIARDEVPNRPPVTMGHEISGVVEEVGGGVRRARVGDRVTVLPHLSVRCGHCRYCRAGYYTMCNSSMTAGHNVDGGFAPYCIVQEEQVFRLPETVPLDLAALSEPLTCSVQAVSEFCHVEPGDTVLISGPGPVGLMTLQLVKAQGARAVVAGLARDEHRLVVAQQLGADMVVEVDGANLDAAVRGLSEGYGADFAFECAGAAASLRQCLSATRKLGTVVLLGHYPRTAEIDPNLILDKQLTVRGSLSHTWATWERTMWILASGLLDLRPLLTHRLPLSEWQEGFRVCEERLGLKVVLRPD
ncbi:MAG: zinc-dependent alcohol dehydrogenase [Chloroflexota bacterium]